MRTTILGVIAITSTMTFACTMTETVTRTESESAKTEPSVVKPTDVGFKSKLAVAKSKITSLVAKRATTTTGKLGVRSGGSACGLSTGDTTCDSCLDGSCCTENKACVADADCTALIACGNACTDDACLAGCFSAHPTGVAILETLSTCVETSCSSACGGGGGGTGGSPSACGFASGNTTCDSCLDTNCCADANACLADKNCTDYLDCAYACSDAACESACKAAHPSGAAKLDVLSTCATTSCGTACGGSGGGGTGGGGSSCGLTSGDPTCDACLDTSCCAQTTTCLGSKDCLAVVGCYDTCADAACAAACDAAHPTGASELGAVFTCAQSNCASTCGL
jgi:hypothetical protein